MNLRRTIPASEAIEWLEQHYPNLGVLRKSPDSEPIATFARRVGISPITVTKLIRGQTDERPPFPMKGRCSVIIEDAIEWIKTYRPDLWNKTKRGKILPGYKSKLAFGKRCGVTGPTIARFVEQGLPNKNGAVHIKNGLRWMSNYIHPKKPPPGYETKNRFAKRVGMNGTSITLCVKKGLPTFPGHPNFIHIENGLRWMETYISNQKIPEGYRITKSVCKTSRCVSTGRQKARNEWIAAVAARKSFHPYQGRAQVVETKHGTRI